MARDGAAKEEEEELEEEEEEEEAAALLPLGSVEMRTSDSGGWKRTMGRSGRGAYTSKMFHTCSIRSCASIAFWK